MEQSLQNEMLSFFEKYLDFYKEFIQLENRKYTNMSEGKVQSLGKIVRNEEAFILRSRGLELERDKLVERTEKPNATFHELIPLFEGTAALRVKEIYQEFSILIKELKQVNQTCNDLTQLKIHKMDKCKELLKNNPELQKQYDRRAKEIAPAFGAFSKKV